MFMTGANIKPRRSRQGDQKIKKLCKSNRLRLLAHIACIGANREMFLADHALMSFVRALDPILDSIRVSRQQLENFIYTGRRIVANGPSEGNALANLIFVICHPLYMD